MHSFIKLALVAMITLSGTVFAQATRTWVSGVGDDVNPCSRTAPCKTFAGSISKTAAGGEINALDPAGYGAITITKSVTIDGHHTLSGILVSGSGAVIINAGVTDVVTLRGLELYGVNSATKGITVTQAKAVIIEDCTINNFDIGIDVRGGTATSVTIRNTTIFNANGTNGLGIVLGNTNLATGPRLVLENTRVINSGTGIQALFNTKGTINNSVISDSSVAGIQTANSAELTVDRGVITHSAIGAKADGSSTIRLSNVLVSNNDKGVEGNVSSFGNNRLNAGNVDAGVPVVTLPLQ